MSVIFDRDEADDVFITSALLSEADIPSASDGFERRCLAAIRSAGSSGTSVARRMRGVAFAAVAAAAISFATWAVTVSLSGSARTEAGAFCDPAVAVEDVSAVGVTASRAVSAGVLAMSNESVVNANPGATALWKALNAGQTQMAWEWPERAMSARLTITGSGITAEKVYGKGDAFPVWNPPVPEDFREDDVFTAKITFYVGEKGAGDEIASLVADGIGFVRGISGRAPRVVYGGPVRFRLAKK